MRLRQTFLSIVILFLSLGVAADLCASEIKTREFASAALNRSWTYTVYLPSGYDAAKRYPVLYLLHGNNQKGSDWVTSGHIQATTDNLIAKGEIPALIIVMPDAGTTWYVDRKEKMETAMLEDLIPEVEHNFATLPGRTGRVVAGLSMGGYGSMRLSFKHPELFAAAALLSPAIYDNDPPENSSARRVGVFGAPNYDSAVWRSLSYPALWDEYMKKQMPVPMYIVSGDDDEFFIEADATKFYSLLRKNKLPSELRIVNGGHTWAVWESTIGDAMRYIMRFTQPAPAPAK